MIAEQYIKDGIRLRKSYIENIKEIVKLEPLINKRKKNFDDLKVEMESIVFSDKNDIRKTVELNNSLIQLDKEVKKVQELVRPFYDKIEALKSERDRIYVAIKEKYPNITDQQIENEIMERVSE